MTTTIETFKFTAPMPTASIRTLADNRVYKALIDEITERMEQPSDYDNGANIEVKVDNYFVEIEISFSAYYRHDYEAFDFGWHDMGDWHSSELYDVEVLDCHKTHEVNGNEFDIDMELDTQRIMKEINSLTF